LTGVFPGTLSNQTKSVYAGLNNHRIPFFLAIPPLDWKYLPRKRVKPGTPALRHK
jgi:hypothetical protein